MKKGLLLFAITLVVAHMMAQEQKEVVTGQGYADDVYYSLDNGTVVTASRLTWDLGFTTDNFSVSILANNGAEVELYAYPKGDTADWETLDTTGMAWTPMYNSIETFDEGAFSANASMHPDYGWGTYNMSTHNITGDSLFVIKTLGGNYKKLAIIVRGAMANTWEFKYANLDGSDEVVELLNAGEYKAKSFVYYSIDSTAVVDREPATGDWDLLFTRYFDYNIPYIVTGVLTNEAHLLAQEVKEDDLDQSTFTQYADSAFTSGISIIGSDWKSFNMGTFAYDVATDVVYFLKKYGETDSTYYKIYFTGFSGSGEGKYTFMQEELMSSVSVSNPGMIKTLELYPNPASQVLNLVVDHQGEIAISIYDITGRNVYSRVDHSGGFNTLSMDIGSLQPGLFFLKVRAGDLTEVIRFIKE